MRFLAKTKIAGIIIAFVSIFTLGFATLQPAFAAPPNTSTLKGQLTNTENGEGLITAESLRISANQSLQENIRNLFSPGNEGSLLRNMVKNIMIGVLVIYFVLTGMDFLIHPNNEEKLGNAKRSFYYMLFGAFLIYAVTWILGTGLQIEAIQGATGNNADGSGGLVGNLTQRILFQVLSFFKAFAFFYAVIMIVYYGIAMMRAMDKEDALKKAKSGILNVLIALVLIKVIDFIFFIAQDASFASRAKLFLFNLAKIVGYLMGAAMVFVLIYAGVKYLTANGDESKVKDARKYITNVFYVVLLVFMFLLVAWQVIAAFG